MKPVIGIVAKPGYKDLTDIWYRMDIVDEIRYLIVKNGGTAIMLLPTEAKLKFNDNDIKDDMNNTKDYICKKALVYLIGMISKGVKSSI